MPRRRDAPLYLTALALFAAALRSLAVVVVVVVAETTGSSGGGTQTPSSAAASASAGAGSGGGGNSLGFSPPPPLTSLFAPPWASAVASVSSVTASAACSLFGRSTSAAAGDGRQGLATAAACEVATNLELWLKPLLSGVGKGDTPFLPAGAKRAPPSLSSSPNSDGLAQDRAAVASTAAASASTTSGGSSSAASASATANARPLCSAATLFPGAGTTRASRSSESSSPSSSLLLPVCSAPSFELVADGGRCAVESRPPHAVVCVGPSVVLEVTPPRCSLSYYDESENAENDDFSSSSFAPPSRSLLVDSHCGPPAAIATGGQRVFLGGKKLLPVAAGNLNGSSSGGDASSSLGEFDRAAATLSNWPAGFGGAPLADAKGLAELLAVSLLPGRVTATASVVEE